MTIGYSRIAFTMKKCASPRLNLHMSFYEWWMDEDKDCLIRRYTNALYGSKCGRD